MTNREAIDILEKSIKCEEGVDCCKVCPDCCICSTPEAKVEAFNMAIAALEKQEPKEAGKHVTDKETWFCPHCYAAYKNAQPSYCPRCGQKLKWETWQYQIEF